MSISSETRSTTPKLGNGVWTEITFNFKIFDTDEILLVQTTDAGVESTLVEGGGNDYTVTLNADQNTSPGGVITLTAVSTSGYFYTATSAVENLQPTNLTNLGGFLPATLNNTFDRLTILVQQVLNKVNRSIKIPLSDGSLTTELPTKAVRASQLLGFDASGNINVVAFGSVVTSFDTLFSGLASGDFIQYNGTNWANKTVAELKTILGISSFAETILDDADASAMRTTLGLGSLATLSTINGSNWSGQDLALADGGTGASTAAGARTALGVYSEAEVDAAIAADSEGKAKVRGYVLANATLQESDNISSITDNGTGDHTVNFSVTMDSIYHSTLPTAFGSNRGASILSQTTTSARVNTHICSSGANSDVDFSLSTFGDLA